MAVPYDPVKPPPTITVPGSGHTPDYQAEALASPEYQAWLTNANATIGKAGDVRRAAAQFAALNYGGLPPGYADPYGDITPDILAQAGANPQSTIHRLQANYGQAQQQMQQGMAARGALHSGDLVFGQQNLDTGFAANQSDAANAFGQALSGPGGVYQGYTDAQTAALSGQGGALQGAITALENDPTNQPTPDLPATLIPDWQNQYGRPMYQGPDGNLYTPDPATGILQKYATADPTDPTGWTYTGY